MPQTVTVGQVFGLGGYQIQDNEFLNGPFQGGDSVLEWQTSGFAVAFTPSAGLSTPVSNTGPLTYWVDLDKLGIDPAAFSFHYIIQQSESYIHQTLSDTKFQGPPALSWLANVLVLIDPGDTRLLVTGPGGQTSGQDADGTVVQGIPGSVDFPSLPLVLVADPLAGDYSTIVAANAPGSYVFESAAVTLSQSLGQQVFAGTLAADQSAIYGTTLASTNGVPQTTFVSSGYATALSDISASGSYGSAGVLSATLTSYGVPLAGKTVAFTLDEAGTVTPVGTANTDSGGVATLTGVSLAGFGSGAFSNAVAASFAGDQNDPATSNAGSLIVSPAPLTVTAPRVMVTAGQAIPRLSYAITGFVNGDTAAVVTGAQALAAVGTQLGLPGVYPIEVAAGTLAAANYTFTTFVSGTLTVEPKAVDQVALASSANPSLPGELMTFGVMVIPLSGGPTPTGTIQFQIDGNNFGAAVAVSGGDAASGLVTSLSIGTHTITAIYSGDSAYPGSMTTLSQSVESPSQVKGHVYTVTSLGDTGTGAGTSGDLHYAITQANANPGSVIDFSVMGTIQLTQSLPNLNSDVSLNGPGPSPVTIKGGGASSDFSVLRVATGVAATISGLTVTGGNNAANGGGVYNLGTLDLVDCVITGNSASRFGGGIQSYDGRQLCKLTLADCTVSAELGVRLWRRYQRPVRVRSYHYRLFSRRQFRLRFGRRYHGHWRRLDDRSR